MRDRSVVSPTTSVLRKNPRLMERGSEERWGPWGAHGIGRTWRISGQRCANPGTLTPNPGGRWSRDAALVPSRAQRGRRSEGALLPSPAKRGRVRGGGNRSETAPTQPCVPAPRSAKFAALFFERPQRRV